MPEALRSSPVWERHRRDAFSHEARGGRVDDVEATRRRHLQYQVTFKFSDDAESAPSAWSSARAFFRRFSASDRAFFALSAPFFAAFADLLSFSSSWRRACSIFFPSRSRGL